MIVSSSVKYNGKRDGKRVDVVAHGKRDLKVFAIDK